MNSQLLEYIKECIKRKIPEDTFKAALISKGWNIQEIDEALESVKKSLLELLMQKFCTLF